MKRTQMLDMIRLSEDQRVKLVGKTTMQGGRIGFVIEDETIDPGKADRYVRKILEAFPRICVDERGPGPVPGTLLIVFVQMNG